MAVASSTKHDARSAESLIRDLEQSRGVRCAGCGASLCFHQTLMAIALGFKDAPRCLPCLGAALAREPAQLRDSLFDFIRLKECFRDAWNWANRGAGLPADTMPPVLQTLTAVVRSAPASTAAATTPGPPDAEWDAGDMGCGELVLELRSRLEVLTPGKIFQLTARDPGAPEDLPAWCRLTGHALVRAEHPNYWIRRQG